MSIGLRPRAPVTLRRTCMCRTAKLSISVVAMTDIRALGALTTRILNSRVIAHVHVLACLPPFAAELPRWAMVCPVHSWSGWITRVFPSPEDPTLARSLRVSC